MILKWDRKKSQVVVRRDKKERALRTYTLHTPCNNKDPWMGERGKYLWIRLDGHKKAQESFSYV